MFIQDAKLVLTAQRGDKNALSALFERYRPKVLTVCRRVLGDPLLAEDAFQEAAVRALLSLNQLRRPASFGPWLIAIALNVCRNWLRERVQSWLWEEVQGGTLMTEPLHWETDPGELLEARDLAVRVREAVIALPPRQRAAVELFYIHDLSHAEIAAFLGVKIGAVKTRLHKARKSLKRQLWTVVAED